LDVLDRGRIGGIEDLRVERNLIIMIMIYNDHDRLITMDIEIEIHSAEYKLQKPCSSSVYVQMISNGDSGQGWLQ
jgi:hypothetical protein